jgi:hypothetical protein
MPRADTTPPAIATAIATAPAITGAAIGTGTAPDITADKK